MPDLRVSLGPLVLSNPVLVAAGTFGYGLEFGGSVPLDRLGGLITKTLTRQPRQGNPPPRLAQTPAGMLNAVGLQNIGLEAFLREKLPALRRARAPLIVSILGESPEELAGMARQLDGVEGVAAVEVNLSCPNIHSGQGAGGEPVPALVKVGPGGREGTGRPVQLVAHDAEATFAMVQAARAATSRPLIAKLSPDVTDLVPIAQAAQRAGATALSVGNTFVGMSLEAATRRSRLGMMTGGLSGPAIRPLAVYRVWYTARSVSLPIIGVGGILRAEDALEFILAGASAVAVGTATFANPRAAVSVLQGLERYLKRHRVESLTALRGTAAPHDA